MTTITVADVINNTLSETGWSHFRLYVFRDCDLVLYVGQTSQNITDRLEEHLGLTYRNESQVGRLVEENAPESYSWCIDLRTLDECVPIIQRHFPESRGIDINHAERALILEFSPSLNAQSNPHPCRLPSKYTWRIEAKMRDAHRRAFSDGYKD